MPKKAVKKDVFETFADITKESVVHVKGKLKSEKQARGGLELIPDSIEVLSRSHQPVPLDISGKIDSGLDTRLDWRSIDLRRQDVQAIFKIESRLTFAIHEYLENNGFIQFFEPCIMGAASESGAEVFPVDYYGKKAFLRQDPQLHRQLTIAGGFEKIYDLGPNWRAEPSHTTRHICEHRGCAVEMAFIKDEQDVNKVEQDLIVHALKQVKTKCKDELALLKKEIILPKKPFPELRFPDVYEILKKKGKKLKKGDDLDRDGELLLAEYVMKKHDSEFFFVNRFPFKAKPFYVMRYDKEWARSVDLVYKGVELSSGGQREHRHDVLMKQIDEKGMKPASLKWFTDPFKYGVPPHGGFCFGIERMVKQMLDLENIREAVVFPRDPLRIMP
jgi:aspartyl-tRNA synthetase